MLIQSTTGCQAEKYSERHHRDIMLAVQVAWPAAATSATVAPDEELQALVDAFLMPSEPSEAADMSAIFGPIDPVPQVDFQLP